MKILKKIILVLIIVIGLVYVAGLFIKNDFLAEREVVINKPKAEVFNYMKMIRNADKYSVWNKKDPNAKKTSVGTDGTVGFKYTWSGNDDIGEGDQIITKIIDGERIDFDLFFRKPFESKNTGYIITEEVSSNQTKVKWGFKFSESSPKNVMMKVMNMEDMLGKDMEKSLQDLKIILEKQTNVSLAQ